MYVGGGKSIQQLNDIHIFPLSCVSSLFPAGLNVLDRALDQIESHRCPCTNICVDLAGFSDFAGPYTAKITSTTNNH